MRMQTDDEQFLQRHADKLSALSVLLLPWYAQNKRDLPWRATRDPYCIFISEIMLQQTRVGAVIGYYNRFTELFPTVRALAQADDDTLLKAWEGLGYYSRARNAKRAAIAVCTDYGGQFPDTAEQLATLPGIGAYTAGAVASIAFDRRCAAVDGNVLRILARVLERKTPDTPAYRKALTNALSAVYPAERCGDFTQSFMDLGSAICLPTRPLCALCPLQSVCDAYAHNTADTLPVRKQKTARKQENLTVFVLRHKNRVAVRKRPDSGLLAGLWELPNVLGHLSPDQALSAVSGYATSLNGSFTVRQCKHVFTHIQWNMLVYDFAADEECDSFTWIHTQKNTAGALPTAFSKCL